MIPGQTKKTHDGGTVRKTEEPSHCLLGRKNIRYKFADID